MGETRIFSASVPAEDYDRLSRIFYNEMYSHNPKTKVAYELIEKNPTTPLGSLQWTLRNEHGLNRSVNGLKKIAQLCGLPYTL